MVTIITGKINSSKTSMMAMLYAQDHCGDGFISIKRMQGDKVHSYSVQKLSTKETRLFIIRDEFNHKYPNIAATIGPYQFIAETLDYLETEIEKMIQAKVSPIYLDEIGLMELEGKIFHKIFRKMLAANLDLCITARDTLIQKIIDKFGIRDYRIIEAT